MRRVECLDGDIRAYFELAARVADGALCRQARCGTVIVKDGEVIGRGYNGPPLDLESNRTCGRAWDYANKLKYDKTCCIHAEWRAILDACKRAGAQVEGSTLYFMRIDEAGSFTDAGRPYCTVCSRLAMESGIAEFALWNEDGADIYPVAEYDCLSYEYHSVTT